MKLIQLVLGFFALGVAVGHAVEHQPPLFRRSYEVPVLKGYGKPGRAY